MRHSGRQRQAAVGFIVALLLIDSIGFGLIVPIVPMLVEHLTAATPSQASIATAGLVVVFAMAQLVFAPVLGALSDRFGRRPVILLSVLGMGCNYLLLIWAPSLAWLFVGRLIAGLTAANNSTATAYIADISAPKEKARRFGLVGASFGLGFVIGPALGGVLGAIDLRLPFAVAAGLAAVNALYGFVVLPESLPPERRQRFSWRGANPVAALRLLAGDRVYWRLALAWSCFWYSVGTLQTVLVLSTALRFGWGTRQNGAALACVGLMSALVQTALVRHVVRRFGERSTAITGFCVNALAYAVLAFATAGWMMFVGITLFALGNVANPAVRAMLSNRAGPERQGRVLGALSAIEGLTALISPLVASTLFRAFAGPDALASFPGMPFLAAALVFSAAVLAVRGVDRQPSPEPIMSGAG